MGERKPGKLPYFKPKHAMFRVNIRRLGSHDKSAKLAPFWHEVGLDGSIDPRHGSKRPTKVQFRQSKNNCHGMLAHA